MGSVCGGEVSVGVIVGGVCGGKVSVGVIVGGVCGECLWGMSVGERCLWG